MSYNQPYTFYLKLTNKCNLKCRHCYNGSSRDQTMSVDLFNRTIDHVIDHAAKHRESTTVIHLLGGEPLLYDHLECVIDAINRTKSIDNIEWAITTNLVHNLTDQHFQIFKACGYKDQSLIQTSWDPSVRFATAHQLKTWEDSVRAITNQSISVQATVSVTSDVVDNYTCQQLFDYMIDHHVDSIQFERVTLTGRAAAIPTIKPTNRKVDQWLADGYRVWDKLYRDKIGCSTFESVERSFDGVRLGCRARVCATHVRTINPDGSVSACPNVANDCFGFDDQSIAAAIDQQVTKESTFNVRCLMCDMFKWCNGDCYQLAHDQTGCPAPKTIYRIIANNRHLI